MNKFGFSIRTRSGHKVENISIMAATLADAEKRLNQMYLHCEIIKHQERSVEPKRESLDVDGLISLISREPTLAAAQASAYKTVAH